jgi:hypothetical protein
MENLMSIIGAGNLDENVNITQDHVNQLFGGVTPLLEKYFQDNPLNCDAECRENLESELLYENYTRAKGQLEDAPQEFENAEKAFYTYSEGGAAYVNFKEGEAATEVNNIATVLSNNFEQKANEIQNRINSLESQSIAEKYMKELNDSYGRDINQIDQEINNYQKKSNINDRLAVYYNRRAEANKGHIFYIRILYWAILMFYFFYFFIFQQLYTEKIVAIAIISLLFLPIIIKPLITWLFPIKIYIPPPPPVCPSKPATKVAPPPVKPFVPPPPWVPPPPTPGPMCPSPTLWSIVKNSMPAWGIPNAKQNFKEKVSNFEDLISYQMSKVANNIHRII